MRHLPFVLLAVVLAASCGASNSPSSPAVPSSPTPSGGAVNGTWSGTSTDSTGQEGMQLNISQNADVLTGSIRLTDPTRGMAGGGAISGSFNGQTVTLHVEIPNGGFNGMLASCSVSLDGQATLSGDGHTLTGTYSGMMSGVMSGTMAGQPCGGAMSNGRFTLTH